MIGFGAGEPDFPTPDYIVDAAVAAAQDPANHRYTPAAGLPALREAIAAKTLRDSGYEVDAVERARHQRRQAGRLPGVRGDRGPGRRGPAARAVLDHLPRGDPPGRRRPGRGVRRRRPGLPGDRRAARGRAHRRAPRCCCSARPSNPTGAVYSAEQTEAIGRWALEHGIWVITDEIYEHLTYDDAVFTPDRARGARSSRTPTIVLNGVAKTYAMTGWRVGWMIGPPTSSRPRPTCSRTSPSNVANVVAARGHRRARPATSTAVDEMRDGVRPPPRAPWSRCCAQIDGVVCPTPAGRVLRVPVRRGRARPDDPGRTPRTSAELATLILEEAEVAVVPGEAFGPSGYLRLSYALGDDDLVEGVTPDPAAARRGGVARRPADAPSARRPPPVDAGRPSALPPSTRCPGWVHDPKRPRSTVLRPPQALRRQARRRRPRPDVEHGEVFALLGPTARARPRPSRSSRASGTRDAGDVRVLGQDPQHGDRAWRARLGIVLQTNNDLAEAHRRASWSATSPGSTRTRATPTRSSPPSACRTRLRTRAAAALRRAAPPPRRGARHRRPTRAAVPRRADHRLRPAGAALVLGPGRVAARRRHHDPAHHALPGGGRAPGRPGGRGARRQSSSPRARRPTSAGRTRAAGRGAVDAGRRARARSGTDTPTRTVVELTGALGGEVPGLQVLRPTSRTCT